MKKISNAGFTLIELLVVIAIIGILSSVVLASLNNARNKAQDGKVEAQMANIKTATELVYDGNKYGTASGANNCGDLITNPALTNLMATSAWSNNTAPACTSDAAASGDSINKWAMSHALVTTPTKHICVDYTGTTVEITGAVATGEDCSGNSL